MTDLDSLLSNGDFKPHQNINVQPTGLDCIKITTYALKKAYAYARLVNEISKQPYMECGGYLITPKVCNDLIARDAFLARDQEVSERLFTLNAEDVIKAGREIDAMGYMVLGWWHSHGIQGTSFSELDKACQLTVLNEICAVNYITQRAIYEIGIENLETRLADGKLIMFDRRNPQQTYEAVLGTDLQIPQNPLVGLRIVQEKRIGFAYGLVVNNPLFFSKEPYAEVATRRYCGFCKTSDDNSEVVGIRVFDEGESKIDEAALKKEIKERVRMKPKFGILHRVFGALEDQKRQGGFRGEEY